MVDGTRDAANLLGLRGGKSDERRHEGGEDDGGMHRGKGDVRVSGVKGNEDSRRSVTS